MRTTQLPDTPVDFVEVSLRAEIRYLERNREELLRELATAESVIDSQQRMLVAGGLMDPELGP